MHNSTYTIEIELMWQSDKAFSVCDIMALMAYFGVFCSFFAVKTLSSIPYFSLPHEKIRDALFGIFSAFLNDKLKLVQAYLNKSYTVVKVVYCTII